MTPSDVLRVGIVGARTARQGIGAYVARAFAAAGAQVVSVVGTRSETVEQAVADLRARFAIDVRGRREVATALEKDKLDVLAICSPAAVHRPALQLAKQAGVHVLCEKPLWWEDGSASAGPALAEQVAALAQGFASQGRMLATNTQWPATLPTYRDLHADAEVGGVQHFSMLMSPTATEPVPMVVDSAPHLISMLRALTGGGQVVDARAARAENGLDLDLGWRHEGGQVEVAFRLRPASEQPRPAGYGVNGRWAQRIVALPEYRMSLRSEDREVELPDPLDALVADFVTRARRGDGPDVPALIESMSVLQDLVRVADDLGDSAQ